MSSTLRRTQFRPFKRPSRFDRALRKWIHSTTHRDAGHMPCRGDRVVIAMSGGVDSSVTARLLANEVSIQVDIIRALDFDPGSIQDYNLSAIFMRNWDTRDESGTDKGCEWEKDWEDVRRVCRTIDLPCEMIDLSRDYWNRVFQPSLRLWEKGWTPNPDVWCNREVKFGSLMDHVCLSLNAQWIATGHYAGIAWDKSFAKPRPKLVRAADRTKDQTYYLSAVAETSLRKTLFPLHNLTKNEVRQLARKFDLPTADREESMGICFVGEKRRFDQFLSDYISPQVGRIVELETGRQIGTHQGLWQYTIGQNARVPGLPTKMFVAEKDAAANTLHVVPGSTHPALYSTGMVVRDFKWIWQDKVPVSVGEERSLSALVQFRHRSEAVRCTIKQIDADSLEIQFAEPQCAITQGQVAAVYDEDWCLGSGVISERSHAEKKK